MKNERIISSWDRLNPGEGEKTRIWNKIGKRQKSGSPVFRPKFAAVMAGIICLALAGGLLTALGNTNVFTVKAYALGESEDGSIELREMDLLDMPDVWAGYFDGSNFYVSVGLKCQGKNIESVEFSTREGFFAKQYIDELSGGEGISKMYVGPDNRLVMYGDKFEPAGSRVTLDGGEASGNVLLFWGMQSSDGNQRPPNIEITAMATFEDGKTQEVPITIDLSGLGVAGGAPLSREEERHMEELVEYYDKIPIEQCLLVPESVKSVTEVYEYGSEGNSTIFPIYDGMVFDEDGYFRCGFYEEGREVFVSVIKRAGDGSLSGMLFRVPENLIYAE